MTWACLGNISEISNPGTRVRRGRQMPRETVWLVAKRARNLQMRRSALGERRGVVNSRPDQRMSELRA